MGSKKDKSIICAEIVGCVVQDAFNGALKKKEVTAGQIFDAIFKDENDDGNRITLKSLYDYLDEMVEREHILVRRDTRRIIMNKIISGSTYLALP